MLRPLSAILVCLLMPGCVIVEIGVTNPIPGFSTVAVAPFFNLSLERSVDGRRFAAAYFAELQKVPGFQVLPVGVTEQAILDNDLQMNDPQDVLELARLLDVDAVVVGAVTDYSPYEPPRIGLRVSWYSRESWAFAPGVPTDPNSRFWWKQSFRTFGGKFAPGCQESIQPPYVRGQSPQLPDATEDTIGDGSLQGWKPVERKVKQTGERRQTLQRIEAIDRADESVVEPKRLTPEGEQGTRIPANRTNPDDSVIFFPDDLVPQANDEPNDSTPGGTPEALTAPSNPPTASQFDPTEPLMSYIGDRDVTATDGKSQFDPTEPLMSYTRMFDGADAALVASLRDYLELRGDRRSGGWEGYLHRSEDFIRFTAHLMIVEMLTLHGGDSRRRIVFKLRKYK